MRRIEDFVNRLIGPEPGPVASHKRTIAEDLGTVFENFRIPEDVPDPNLDTQSKMYKEQARNVAITKRNPNDDVVMHFGQKRLGRRTLDILDERGKVTQQTGYFYDVIDPQHPFLRLGVDIRPGNAELYSTTTDGTPEQFNYSRQLTEDETLDFLADIPRKPGDMKFRVENPKVIVKLFEN